EVLDLAAAELAAVFLDIQPEAVLDGFAKLGVGAGVGQHQADPQLVLGLGEAWQQGDCGDADGKSESVANHAGLLVTVVVVILPELAGCWVSVRCVPDRAAGSAGSCRLRSWAIRR